MKREEERTGETDFIETPQGVEEIELTETFMMCTQCGWIVD